MTADEKIKEVMELVNRHGSHRELEGFYSDCPDSGHLAITHGKKSVKLRTEIEAKLRQLIKDDASSEVKSKVFPRLEPKIDTPVERGFYPEFPGRALATTPPNQDDAQ